MENKRQALQHEFEIFCLRKEHCDRNTSMTFEHYCTIRDKRTSFLTALSELTKEDGVELSKLLNMPSDRHFFKELITEENISKIECIIDWLSLSVRGKKILLKKRKAINKGIEIGVNRAKKEIKSIKEFKVTDFARMVDRHPNTIRSDFKKGKIVGRQDTKGIWIDASALARYGITNDK